MYQLPGNWVWLEHQTCTIFSYLKMLAGFSSSERLGVTSASGCLRREARSGTWQAESLLDLRGVRV